MKLTKRSFLHHTLTACLAAGTLFLTHGASRAAENVFEAVPLGVEAYIYG